MPLFLRPQSWEIAKKGYKDWLDLGLFIKKIVDPITTDNITALNSKEDKLNKVNEITPSILQYPNNQAVIDYVENNQNEYIFTADVIVSLANQGKAGKYATGQTIPLIGKTPQEVFDDMYVETLFPTLIAPSLGPLTINQDNIQETGTKLNEVILNATFNRGSITPAYTTNGFRAGLVNSHVFTGPGIGDEQANQSNSLVSSFDNYTVLQGINTFTAQLSYDEGEQPKNSIGVNFNTPLPAGSSNIVSANIQGILPYFFGKSIIPIAAAETLIKTETKVIANSNNTININFNANSEYLFFAIPNTSVSKTKWFINALNNGNIGQNTDLFNNFTLLNIQSPDGLWENQSYKIYVSNYPTTTSGVMELRNS